MTVLLDAFSELPAGGRVVRTYDEIAKALDDSWISNEDDRIREMKKRVDLYEDRTWNILKDQIRRQFGSEEIIQSKNQLLSESRFQNVTRRIINEISTVYSENAKRSVAAADGYQEFLRVTHFQRVMEVVNQRLNLCNEVWLSAGVDRAGAPVVRVATPDRFWAISHPLDPIQHIGMVFPIPARGIKRSELDPHFVVWSATEKFFLNGNKRIVKDVVWPEGTAMHSDGVAVNPLGAMPGVLLHRRIPVDRLLDWDTGKDLISAHEAIMLLNLLLLDEQKSGTVLVYAKGDTKDMASGQPMDRKFLLHVPEDVDIDSIDLKADPQSYLSTAKSALHQIAANYGIPGDVFEMSMSSSSGFEIRLKRTRLVEMRRDQAKDFRDHERRFVEVASIVMDREGPPEVRFAPEGFTIDFGETEIPRSAKEKLESRKMARSMGLSNPIDEVMADDPDLDEKAAEKIIDRNLEIWGDLVMRIKEINGLDSDGRTPQQNGAMAHHGGMPPTPSALPRKPEAEA